MRVLAIARASSVGFLVLVTQECALAQSAPEDASSTAQVVAITAALVPLTQREVPESVTIITRADIERMYSATGVDLFRLVPGLQIDQLGGAGGLSSVYIRGSDPNHVLILIDGVRVNDTTNSRGGGYDMSNLDPAMIDHVEVLRGAGSAVYGAEAMGGVINIVMRNGLDDNGIHGGARAGVGGQDYRDANAWVAVGAPALRFSASGSKLKDGNDAEGGGLNLTHVAVAARWTIEPTASLRLDVRHNERASTSFPDDSGGLEFAQRRTLDRKYGHETIIGVGASWDLAYASLRVNASSYDHDEDIVSPGVAPGVRSSIGVPASVSSTNYQRSNANANLIFHILGGNELAVGGEFQREHGYNHTVYNFFGSEIPVDFNLTRISRSAYAELKWQVVRDLTVRAGVRRDDVQGVGSQTNPSVGVRYNLPALDGAVKANYSKGFKPPSFFVLGLPLALGGNPNLLPEHSRGGSIGYEQRLWGGRATFGGSMFRTRYSDLVTYNNETNQTVNADRVDIRGFEVEGLLRASNDLTLQANFTRLVSKIADSDEPLRQRPGLRSSAQVAWAPHEHWLLTWRTSYSAKSFDSAIPTGNLMLPTSVRSDLNGTWRFLKGCSLSAAIDNVFDKKNQSYIGAVEPGRRIRVSIRMEL